ncbi:MAG: response regulator [Planctomycetales bacterium]
MTSRARILVIDDDPLFRSLIVSILRKDYIVSVAADGEEGYYKALEHNPDVAVVDVQMPGWDGLKTLNAFRMQPTLKNTPVVMLTGDASKDTVMAAVHGGANDYVIKTSFSKEEFLGKLHRLLGVEVKPQAASTSQTTSHPSHASATTMPRHAPAAMHTDEHAGASSTSESDSARLTEIMEEWE